jgi:hypothetical protein
LIREFPQTTTNTINFMKAFAALSLSLSLFILSIGAAAGDQSVATSYSLRIPPGVSTIANHLDRGGNTVAELLPAVPEGTLLYKFDGIEEIYTVNQFQFGSWLRPEEILAPGEGAFIRNPGKEFSITFSGTKPSSTQFPELNTRWSLASLPAPGETLLPRPENGVNILRFDALTQSFVTHTFDSLDQAWSPRFDLRVGGNLMTNLGESFFYKKLGSPTFADATVYFSTYLPGAVDARITWKNGAGIGQGLKAQLYGGPSGTPVDQLAPLQPQTTFQTRSAAASGYVNPVLVTIPGVVPNTSATLLMRVFDGASYETSSVRGESDPITVRVGGIIFPPGNLTSLPGFSLPTPAGAIAVERISNGIRFTYTGTLQSADIVTGPYTDVAGAISPANITFSGTARFYRIKP